MSHVLPESEFLMIKCTPCRLALVAVLAVCATSAAASGELTHQQRTFFEQRIRPVLVRHCYECHSHDADALSSDYAVDSRDGLRAGGASGQVAIVPGDPDGSRLMQAVRYDNQELEMPPDERLPEAVIADFERWIAMGAPDPRSDDRQAVRRRARAASAAKLWSLQRPVEAELPQVNDQQWPRTAVDRFVLARMEREGLQPVADADPRELLRRVYFDLIGLPPKPREVERFAAAPTQSSLARIVDRLLRSPRFGERWGRHWLDLARYAESSGMEFNFTYPHAWPYRDYVIDSFNQDKPYDRFLTEQLAGDLLPAASKPQRDENRLATGFLAIGPKRHNAGTTLFRMDIVDDQIRATGEAFLGLTIGCARCHDHKFDPIPTEDYYALAGIFLSTKTLHGTTKIKYSRHPSDLVPFGPDSEARHQKYAAYRKKLKTAEKKLADKREQLKKLDGEKKKKAKAEIRSFKKEVARLKADAPEPPKYAMGAADGKLTDTHVAVGGDPRNKGDTVRRGFLSSIQVHGVPSVTDQSSGRLEMARWITSRDNPLTARVMVNRIWHHLFGRGLVPSVNNFGTLGDKPSHPLLLDYLAVRFMEDGWSTKRLIRSLVLSRVYQLSTRKNIGCFKADPENVLLWRMTPRRLQVEALRDAILAVSGQLDLSRPTESPITALGQQLARRVPWKKLNPASRYRTVYLPVVRHYAPHMLQEFDFAASSLVVGDRAETTTSQQALFLLNNDFILKQAAAMARLLMDRYPDDTAAQIQQAYWRALSRPPTSDERAIAGDFVRRAATALADRYDQGRQRQTMALAGFLQTLFGSAEFRYLIHSPQPRASQFAVRSASATH